MTLPGDEAVEESSARGQGRLTALRRSLRAVRPLAVGCPRYVVSLSASSLLAGFVEAGILYLVVQAATLIASGQKATTIRLGPFAFDELDLARLLGSASGLLLVLALLALLASLSAARLVTRVVNQSRKRAFGSYVAANWSEQSKEPEGQLQALLSGHIQRIGQGVLRCTQALTACLNFLAYFISAVVVDPIAAGGVLFGVCLVAVVLLPLSRVTRRLSRANLQKTEEYALLVTQHARLAREVKVFGVEEEVRRRAERTADEAERFQFRSRFLAKLTPQLYQCTALLVVIAGIALLAAVQGEDVGQLGAIVLLVVRALTYGQNVSTSLQGVVEAEPYVRSVVQSERRFVKAAVKHGRLTLGPTTTIAFRNVSFGYDTQRQVLHQVDFEVPHGEAVGLIGPSGSGKSTIVQLLLRLQMPTTGIYEVDGRPANDYDHASWASAFALVPQDNQLLRATVAENIAFFRADIDRTQVEHAAQMAHLHEDVMALPQGYETQLGTGARDLSGGQRQRLGLARALAGEPSVLILDEPTSALDMRSEQLIQESLTALRGEVTLFIIAHRMPTLAICDRILILEAGRLITIGSHHQLVQDSPYYREALRLSGMRTLEDG